MRFSERFTFLREHILGLKGTAGREELAGKIGCSYKTIERWESKKSDNFPSGEYLTEILSQFPDKKINLTWLFSGSGEPLPGTRQQYPEICGSDESPDVQETLDDLEGSPIAHRAGFARGKNKGDETGAISLGKDGSLSMDVVLHYIEEFGKLKERMRIIEAELKCQKPPDGIERRRTWQKFDKIFPDLQ